MTTYVPHPTLARNVDQAIAHGPPHLREIMRAVRDESCAYTSFNQGGLGITFDTAAAGPVISLIGDDLFVALGPSGFACRSVDAAIKQSRFAAIISGEPEPHLYEAAATVASRDRQHVMIVETKPVQAIAWMRYLQKLHPGIRFLPSGVPAGRA